MATIQLLLMSGEHAGYNASLLHSRRCRVQVRKSHSKGHVKAQTVRHGPRFPKAEHCLPRGTNPEKCDPALGYNVRQRHSQLIPVESHGAVKVCDREMSLEQVSDGSDVFQEQIAKQLDA